MMLSMTVLALSLSGAVNVEPFHLLAQADLSVPPAPPPEAPLVTGDVSVVELTERARELRKLRPSLGAPIALMSVGGASVLLGVGYFVIALMFAIVTTNPVFWVIGAVFCGVGAPLLIAGAVMLASRLHTRREINEELREVEEQLRQQRNQGRTGSTVRAPAPAPALVLARF